jgi:hypothetical protein
MTLATNPDAMGVVFVIVWTGLCLLGMAVLSQHGGKQ